jgi:exodeoxyribonuclease-3
VDRSIDNPGEFINSNIMGVYNLLECFRGYSKKYKNDALAQPESRKEFYKLINLDLIDVFKTTPKKQSYTFFDYKTYKFGKEEGIRIDFFLLSPFLKSKIMKLKVLKEYRDMDRPSDHCPILIDLNI